MEDMSPAAPMPRRRQARARGQRGMGRRHLEADLGAPRKQRRAARRIYDRLVAVATAALTPPCRVRPRAAARPGRRRAERGTSSSSGRPAPAGRFRELPRGRRRTLDLKLLVATLPALNDRQCVALMSRGRSACAPGCSRSSAAGAAPRRRWLSTTPPRRAGWYAARSRNRGCSRSSEPTTASRAGTATPASRETRRAPSRTPWGCSGATSSSPCLRSARSPSSTRSSPRGARGSTRRRAAATAGRTREAYREDLRRHARPSPAWSSTR